MKLNLKTNLYTSCTPLARLGLLAFLLVFSPAFLDLPDAMRSRAHAQTQTFEYTVQQGDTCGSIAQRFYGSRQAYDRIHRHNHLGPTPHRLRAGTKLTLPQPDAASAPDARVTQAVRTVEAREPSGSAWQRARRGLGLYRGWRVNTSEDSRAQLTFRDKSVVQMRENTLVIVYGSTSNRTSRRQTANATLERGTLRSRLGELRMQVDTPNGQTELDGGSSVISVDEEGSSRVSNHEGGSARVRNASGSVNVRPGYGTKVVRGQRPARPRRLPPKPTWPEDGTQEFIGWVNEGVTVKGQWNEVTGAHYYRVQLSRDADGGDVLAAVIIPATVRTFEVHRLPAGSYYVQVAAQDNDHFESRPSETLELRASLIGLQAPGVEAPERTRVAEGDWGRRAGTQRVLQGTQAYPPEDIQCAIKDNADNANNTDTTDSASLPSVTLQGQGRVELQCQRPAVSGPESAESPDARDAVVFPLLPIEVVAPEVTFADGAPTVVRGQATPITMTLTSDEPLPENLRVVGLDNEVTIRDLQQEGNLLRFTLQTTQNTQDDIALRVVASGADENNTDDNNAEQEAPVIASTTLRAEDPLVEAAPDPEPIVVPKERPHVAANETLGLSTHPLVLGLRDDRRRGSGAWISFAHNGRLANNEGYWRATMGVEGEFHKNLRIGLSHPIDFGEQSTPPQILPEARGDRDLNAWASYRIFGSEETLALTAELAAWFPTGMGEPSIGRTRIAPSVHMSYAVSDRLELRTRQGAILGTNQPGPFVWASAYGIDYRIVAPLALGLEVDATMGGTQRSAITGRSILGVGVGLSASYLCGPVVLGLGARYALTDDYEQTIGRFTLAASLRIAFEGSKQ